MSLIYQLNVIFQEVFDDPSLAVRPQTSPDDIADWDSVAQVKLVLAVEDAFATRLTTDEVTRLHCVGDFLGALNKRIGAAS
jgi:acyl carrier protein